MARSGLASGTNRVGAALVAVGHFRSAVALLAIAVAALILYPVVSMVTRLFFGESGFNLAAFGKALAQPSLGTVLVNTLVFVVASGVLALLIGSVIAWLNERTDAGFGMISDVLPVIPLLVPPIAGTIGWVFLLSPSAGFMNHVLRQLLAVFGFDLQDGPLSVYSFPGMIFVNILYLVPYVYLIVSAALRNLDPALEEASRMCGDRPWTTLRRITLPGVAPALAAAGLLVMITSFSLFSIPVIIGTPPRIDVLSVRIYRLITGSFPPQMDVATVLGFSMLLIVQGAMLLQGMVARAGHYATIGGRGMRASRATLGVARWPARISMIAYLLATTLLPVIGIVLVSTQNFWSPEVAWAKLTLDNYGSFVFGSLLSGTALRNSLGLAAIGATTTMLIAAVVALFIQRAGRLLGQVVDGVTMLPATVPHIVTGVAFLLAFAGSPFNLHGTWLLLFLAYFVLCLPQAMRAASVALSQIGRELTEASQLCGASRAATFLRIVLPLMVPGLVAGWVIVFVLMVGEVTASALLAGVGNAVVGPVLLDLWENGTFPQLAALAMIVTILNTIVVGAVLRFSRGGLQARLS